MGSDQPSAGATDSCLATAGEYSSRWNRRTASVISGVTATPASPRYAARMTTAVLWMPSESEMASTSFRVEVSMFRMVVALERWSVTRCCCALAVRLRRAVRYPTHETTPIAATVRATKARRSFDWTLRARRGDMLDTGFLQSLGTSEH